MQPQWRNGKQKLAEPEPIPWHPPSRRVMTTPSQPSIGPRPGLTQVFEFPPAGIGRRFPPDSRAAGFTVNFQSFGSPQPASPSGRGVADRGRRMSFGLGREIPRAPLLERLPMALEVAPEFSLDPWNSECFIRRPHGVCKPSCTGICGGQRVECAGPFLIRDRSRRQLDHLFERLLCRGNGSSGWITAKTTGQQPGRKG